jgi:hypothetical protein
VFFMAGGVPERGRVAHQRALDRLMIPEAEFQTRKRRSK